MLYETVCGSYLIRVAAVFWMALWVGCAHYNCAQHASNQLLRITRISGGEVPVVYLLELYDDGLIKLDKIGFRTHCRRADESSLTELHSLLASSALHSLESSPQVGHGWAEAHIESKDLNLKVALEKASPQLLPLFQAVDALFQREFGRRYDMPLIARN